MVVSRGEKVEGHWLTATAQHHGGSRGTSPFLSSSSLLSRGRTVTQADKRADGGRPVVAGQGLIATGAPDTRSINTHFFFSGADRGQSSAAPAGIVALQE
jgi:hypothetical protein